MKLNLEPKENELYNKILKLFNEVKVELSKSESNDDEMNKKIKEAGGYAHKLHMLLKKRGLEPKHHDYMAIRREMKITDPKFYMHFHPIEDLLKFILDPTANDDPQEITIGEKFNFKIYSQRWGHYDSYTFIRTENGWKIDFMGIGGSCDEGGYPFLYKNLQKDGISYPNDIDDYLSLLWKEAKSKGLTKVEVQKALQQLADWISLVEKSAPDMSYRRNIDE